MIEAKAIDLLNRYRAIFKARLIVPHRAPLDVPPDSARAVVQHCFQMIDQMDEFVRLGKDGKFFRWLGFVQGAMWALGIRTIDQMREDNREILQP